MVKKIIEGYKNLFAGAGKILILLAFCTAIGAALVFPLCKFAGTFPKAYSITVLSLLLIVFVFFISKKIRNMGAEKALKALFKFLIIAGGVSICVILIFMGKRFFSIPVVFLMIFLYGLVAFKK